MALAENSMPQPLALQPLAHKTVRNKSGGSEHPPRDRSGTIRSRPVEGVQQHHRAISRDKPQEEIPNFVSEVFMEEYSYRTQARRFLWEFFD